MSVLSIVVWLLATGGLALWLGRAWSTGRFAARNRAKLIMSGVDCVIALALVRAIAPPPGVWSWLWLVGAAGLGLGLAGAVRRWSALPWRAPKRHSRARRPSGPAVAGAVVYAAVGAGLVALLA